MNQLKQALRQLTRRPGLSLIVILMLALGLGATTAMFSLYHEILVRPLPVPEPERLVNLAAPGPKPGGAIRDLGLGDSEAQFTYPMFRDLEAAQTVFTGLAAYVDFLANFSFRDRPMSGRGWLVSGSYFDVLRLQPALGRLIGPQDEPQLGEAAVAVLGYDYWQSQFGGDPGVIGEILTVNGQSLEIVGVAPAGFKGTNLGVRPAVFVPLTFGSVVLPSLTDFESRQVYWLYLFARLEPGVTLERAAAELNVIYSGILNEVEAPMLSGWDLPEGTLDRFRERQVTLSPGGRGKSNVPATAARPLALLLGVTALVLMIVCVNIANLLLARGASRASEMAIRASIGASRGALLKQLLLESCVLLAIGGVMSLVVAVGVVELITGFLPEGLALGLEASLTPAAVLFAAGVSLVTVLVFGAAPAWRVSDTNPGDVIKAHAGRTSGSRGAVRFRAALTTAQIAFSLVLLVLAGLFARSLVNVVREDLGMGLDSVVQFAIQPRLNAYGDERLADLYDRIEETLGAQPGVSVVGSTAIPVFYDYSLSTSVSVRGFEAGQGDDTTVAWNLIGSGFFDALGTPLLAGRAFTDDDTAEAPPVAIVNESFLRKFGIDADDAVGTRLGFGTTTEYPVEIAGVVADAKFESVKEQSRAVLYAPRRQGADAIQAMFYYVRSDLDPAALLTMIPRVLAAIDPEVPVMNLQTMRERIDENVYIDRLLTTLSAGFAGLATLLAAIGLYGVLAYNVTQRTRELGLRLALGAGPKRLRAMVLKQVGVMGLAGAAIGLVAAFALGRAAEAVLFGLSGHDPVVLATAVVVLAGVVLAGSWLPARRASSIAPTEALRYE